MGFSRFSFLRLAWAWQLAYCAALLTAETSFAAVTELKIESREPLLDGEAFGAAGAYEKLQGKVTFALDPDKAANARIVDLDKAPRERDGAVVASANFMVLKPRDPEKASGVGVLEVSNRGGKALLAYLNAAEFANDPSKPADFGDGFLLRQGLTLMWVGWQWDVPETPGAMRLSAPIAKENGEAIKGPVRADWVLDQSAEILPLSHRNHTPYTASNPDDPANVLTERDGRDAPRHTIPREAWRFVRAPGSDAWTHVQKKDGFEAGKIYELVYRAQDPRVAGIGLAAVRDFMAFAKYDPKSPFAVKHGVALGVSQTGRFLRHFLYQGFNTDEADRQVFDGMFIHSAGAGRGSFNHRFAQPSRDAHRFSSFFYPTDIFPFSGAEQRDPETGISAGIMPKKHAPKVFYTNTGYEYWGRAAAMIHLTPDAKADVAPLSNERLFHLASGQHFVVPFPPKDKLRGSEAYLGDPLDFLVNLRALITRLNDWVAKNREPPPSAIPRIADKTLVAFEALSPPKIKTVAWPKAAHFAYRVDYGPRWDKGIIDHEPPKLGKPFPMLIPQVDEFGNELGGIRNVEIRAPLATYTPWSLRIGPPGPQDELMDFFGTFTPLAKDEAQRKQRGDSRPSVKELYPDRDTYLAKAKQAAQELAREGFLLEEDIPRVLKRAEQTWDWLNQKM